MLKNNKYFGYYNSSLFCINTNYNLVRNFINNSTKRYYTIGVYHGYVFGNDNKDNDCFTLLLKVNIVA